MTCSNWPFPPPTGPVPWTKKQINDFKKKVKSKVPEPQPQAPF